MKWRCRVRRMQVWNVEVEADDFESAKDKADAVAADDWNLPHDDYAYDTIADEIKEL